MRFIFTFCLILGCAAVGGVFPGSFVALLLARSIGCGGALGEAICFFANLALGIAGAFCGLFYARLGWAFFSLFSNRPLDLDERLRRYIPLAVIVGLIAGAAGYLWFDWVLRNADPPL